MRNGSKGLFVCIIGIDGSGKTTLTNELIKELKKNGIEIEYRWGKFESSILKLIIFIKNKLFIREKDWKKNYEKSLKVKKKLLNNSLLSWLYEQFVLISYVFQVYSKIAIPLKKRTNIVCDRYVYDTIVDLAYDLEYTDKKIKQRLDQLLRLLPQPDILFFIDVPEEIAFNRKNDVPSLEFLKKKKEFYFKILQLLNKRNNQFILLDGTKSIHDLKAEVMNIVGKHLKR